MGNATGRPQMIVRRATVRSLRSVIQLNWQLKGCICIRVSVYVCVGVLCGSLGYIIISTLAL